MKLNFRKIASVLTSAVMLSSTVAIASAASFPAPFVNNGAGTYAVVYGSTSVTGTDNVAAADINAFLSASVTTTPAENDVDVSSPTEGDWVQIQKSNNKFNLGDALNDFATLNDDSDKLPVLLETLNYWDANNDEYEYDQEIELGAQTLGWQQDRDYNNEEPWIGFKISSGNIMTYTLTFNDDVPETWDGTTDGGSVMKNTIIKMMGRDFYISNVDVVEGTGVQLTLLDTANAVRIMEGETQTITVGGQSYSIKLVSVSTGEEATLEVNGVELSNSLGAGDTARIRGTESYIGVKDVTATSRETSPQSAVITVGSGQIIMTDGEEVEINGDAISEIDQYDPYVVTAAITNTSGNLESIALTWSVDDDVFISSGSSITFPAFDTVKLSMGNWVTPTYELTSFEDSSDALLLTTEIKDGEVEIPLFYSTNDVVIAGLGGDNDDRLVTNASTGTMVTLDADYDDFFVATWVQDDDAESFVFRIKSVSGSDNETVLDNLAAGAGEITLSQVGDDQTVGSELLFTLLAADKTAKTALINVSADSGSVYLDRIVTKEGMQMKLPILVSGSATAANGEVNSTSTVFNMSIMEEDEDSGDVGSGGKAFSVRFGPSEDGAEVKGIDGADLESSPLEDRSDITGYYVVSDLASYLELNDVDNGAATLDIDYAPSESYAQVYVSESAVSVSGGGSAGTVIVTDSQVSSVSSKNLIVVGGSCVNTVAAKLIDSTSTAPICGADWQALTSVGSGSFLIQTFTSPYAADKVATLVAGYDAADTTNAANALKTQSVDTTVGNKYIGRAGQTLQLTTQ